VNAKKCRGVSKRMTGQGLIARNPWLVTRDPDQVGAGPCFVNPAKAGAGGCDSSW